MELNSELDRIKKNNKQLKKENELLVKENVKLTKRRGKFKCRIEELERECSELIILLKEHYNDQFGIDKKEFKLLFKKYKKQIKEK
jgi:hypothetical protein